MSEKTFSQLVVVGSSAGGIEALSKVVSTLPTEFPAPIVIAQHLAPERESHLHEILSRKSTLPVRTVTEHAPLEAGVVFVVPANRHVNITDSEIELSEDSSSKRPMPSIDRLMQTAAAVFGERLIAVVLSGTGSDGKEGARFVRQSGGTVVIQDPQSAEFGGMPGSLAPNTVDIIARLDRIGPVLWELISQIEVSEQQAPEDERRSLAQFLEHLRDQYGVDFTSYKTPTILRRLKRRMVATGTESIEEYTGYLDEHPEEYRPLINAFLIKVTEFFRDSELFDYLKDEVLPDLVEQARQNGRQLRIWSAGCATGEEAYSLAILVHEALGEQAGLFDVRIFATDADDDAVGFARHGIYPPSALSGLSEEQIEQYFEPEGAQYQIKKHLRSMIVFGDHDLARRSPFPRIDLVMSRNVLIYFTSELQQRALRIFAYSLRDGGYLVLGKAETSSPLNEFFAQQHRQHKVYQRHGERFLMPPALSSTQAPVPQKQRAGNSGADNTPRSRDASQAQRELRQSRMANEAFLNGLPVGMVVVDRRYDIQAINAAARRMLSVRGSAIGEDLLHLVQNVPYTEVRRVIDAAFREGGHAYTGEFGAENVATGEPSYLQLACHPQREEGEEGPPESVVVVITDVTDVAQGRRETEEQLELARAELEHLRHEAREESARQSEQNERLASANRQLEEANRELTNLNDELRFSNEESTLSTEEAQASTEEVETLNEELQATNEELETLNEELQATVEELNTTNDDLQARSTELQHLAQTREDERRKSEAARMRLDAVLSGMTDAVFAVDAQGEMLFSNESFQRTFGESADELLGDLALYDEHKESLRPEDTPRARASRSDSFETRFLLEDGGEWRVFEARGYPISNDETGGVIVVREVTA